MKITVFVMTVLLSVATAAQDQKEEKPVPKDSVRVFVPGCSKGYVFTAARPTEDQSANSPVPPGTHLRMNGPKKLMADIKGQEGSRIEITGIMKKGQALQNGVGVGNNVRILPGASPSGGSMMISAGGGQVMIDVEGWRRIAGECP